MEFWMVVARALSLECRKWMEEAWKLNPYEGIYRVPTGLKWHEPTMGLGHLI